MYNISIKLKRGTLLKAMLLLQVLLFSLKAQNLILNGSFENNLCTTSTQSCSNHKYDSLMAYSHSFGVSANLDILTSTYSYCGANGATQDGNWFIGVSNGGADALSLTLSSTLIQGQVYTLSFYDRQSLADTAGSPVQIGMSSTDSTTGTILYTSTPPITCQWAKHFCSFVAPANAKYITVTCPYYTPVNTRWTHIDNFVLDTGSYAGISKIDINHNQLTIYPNPSNGTMSIEYNLQKDAYFEITDINGTLVSKYNLPANNTKLDVRNENLNNGVYMYRVISDKISTGKFVIMK